MGKKSLFVDDSFGDYTTLYALGIDDHPRTANPVRNQAGFNRITAESGYFQVFSIIQSCGFVISNPILKWFQHHPPFFVIRS